MKRRQMLGGLGVLCGCALVAAWTLPRSHAVQENSATAAKKQQVDAEANDEQDEKLLSPLPQTEAEWRKILNRQQYRVLRLKDTERAFSGPYWDSKKRGVYRCAGCGLTLFRSEHKYDSGTGWPSYWQPIEKEHIQYRADNSLFTRRTEVICGRCEGHLGHVFNDGPRPTGLRYCINSAALKLDEAEVEKASRAEKGSR